MRSFTWTLAMVLVTLVTAQDWQASSGAEFPKCTDGGQMAPACRVDMAPNTGCDDPVKETRTLFQKTCPRLCGLCGVDCTAADPPDCTPDELKSCRTSTSVFNKCPTLCSECWSTTATTTTKTTTTTKVTTTTRTLTTTTIGICSKMDNCTDETDLQNCNSANPSKLVRRQCPVICGACKLDCTAFGPDPAGCAGKKPEQCKSEILTATSCPHLCGECMATTTSTTTKTTATTTTTENFCDEGHDETACYGQEELKNCDIPGGLEQDKCPQLCGLCQVKCNGQPDNPSCPKDASSCKGDGSALMVRRMCPILCGECKYGCCDAPDHLECSDEKLKEKGLYPVTAETCRGNQWLGKMCPGMCDARTGGGDAFCAKSPHCAGKPAPPTPPTPPAPPTPPKPTTPTTTVKPVKPVNPTPPKPTTTPNPTTKTRPTAAPSGLSVGVYAGIGGGGFVFLVLVIGVCLRRKVRSRRYNMMPMQHEAVSSGNGGGLSINSNDLVRPGDEEDEYDGDMPENEYDDNQGGAYPENEYDDNNGRY